VGGGIALGIQHYALQLGCVSLGNSLFGN